MPKKKFNVELAKPVWELFRTILKVMDFVYEPSECGDQVHVEIECTEQDAAALEATLKVISENLQTA